MILKREKELAKTKVEKVAQRLPSLLKKFLYTKEKFDDYLHRLERKLFDEEELQHTQKLLDDVNSRTTKYSSH